MSMACALVIGTWWASKSSSIFNKPFL